MGKPDATLSNTWTARNWSADAGEGSIHDDATAAKLGFRGGTVAGSIHMDQYVRYSSSSTANAGSSVAHCHCIS